jgi:hypothetical protein
MTKGTAVGMGMATVLVMATALVEEHLPTKEVLNRDIFLHPSTKLPLRLQRLRASSRIPLRQFVPKGGLNRNLERKFPFQDFFVQMSVTRPLRTI